MSKHPSYRSEKLQRDPNDALGWLLDYMLACARGDRASSRPCPKAVARAHAQLQHERDALAALRAAPATTSAPEEPTPCPSAKQT